MAARFGSVLENRLNRRVRAAVAAGAAVAAADLALRSLGDKYNCAGIDHVLEAVRRSLLPKRSSKYGGIHI